MELIRALDPVYLDQARASLAAYVATTLRYSQLAGGRYNPPGEFGALYTSDDETTAWEELAARFRREGIPALPSDMGLYGPPWNTRPRRSLRRSYGRIDPSSMGNRCGSAEGGRPNRERAERVLGSRALNSGGRGLSAGPIQAVHVASRTGPFTQRLLGTHVLRRANDEARRGEPASGIGRHRSGPTACASSG